MCEIFSGQVSDWYSSKTRHFCLKDQSTLIRLGNAFWATLDNIGKRDGVTTTIFILLCIQRSWCGVSSLQTSPHCCDVSV